MRYLVLYHEQEYLGQGDTGSINSTSSKWEEFGDKEEAIEFARDNKGVIVEAFEFDIKKEK